MRRVARNPGDSMGLRSITGRILPRTFYERGTEQVARDLLGAVIVSRIGGTTSAGQIVEVEAYLGPSDASSHAVVGRTERTWHLFGRPGIAYVYFTYGMHWCVNAVAGRGGLGGEVDDEGGGERQAEADGAARVHGELRFWRRWSVMATNTVTY